MIVLCFNKEMCCLGWATSGSTTQCRNSPMQRLESQRQCSVCLAPNLYNTEEAHYDSPISDMKIFRNIWEDDLNGEIFLGLCDIYILWKSLNRIASWLELPLFHVTTAQIWSNNRLFTYYILRHTFTRTICRIKLQK
jgi:hypothetical protein